MSILYHFPVEDVFTDNWGTASRYMSLLLSLSEELHPDSYKLNMYKISSAEAVDLLTRGKPLPIQRLRGAINFKFPHTLENHDDKYLDNSRRQAPPTQ